eukprot:1093418-Rhodomonas_salina.1
MSSSGAGSGTVPDTTCADDPRRFETGRRRSSTKWGGFAEKGVWSTEHSKGVGALGGLEQGHLPFRDQVALRTERQRATERDRERQRERQSERQRQRETERERERERESVSHSLTHSVRFFSPSFLYSLSARHLPVSRLPVRCPVSYTHLRAHETEADL